MKHTFTPLDNLNVRMCKFSKKIEMDLKDTIVYILQNQTK